MGCELVPHLRSLCGAENVVATDVREPPKALLDAGPFHRLDVTDALALERIIVEQKITTIVHLAALLSATGEKNPHLALQVNNMGATNVLEAARVHGLSVFSPSTIAVFGPSTPRENTPDSTVMRPTTIYGVTKVHLELLGEYYHAKFGVNVCARSPLACPRACTLTRFPTLLHAAWSCARGACGGLLTACACRGASAVRRSSARCATRE